MDENSRKYLTIYHKFAYASGDFGTNFCYTFISSFVMIYLTNTIGMNSGIVGTLMLISRVLDGITDVASGTIIDRTKSRLGKARFWMLVTIPLIAISIILLFSIPNASSYVQYTYFFIVYTILNDFFYTMNNVAYSTLSMLITNNKHERVQLGAFRFIGTTIAGTAVNALTLVIVANFGGGVQGWRCTAIIYAVLFTVFNLLCVLPLREIKHNGEISNENTEEHAPEEAKSNGLLENIVYLIRNKFFLMLLGSQILNYIFGALIGGVCVYYTTYVLGNASLLGAFSLTMMGYLIGLGASPFLVKKFGIYKTNLYSMCIVVVADILFVMAALFTGSVTFMLICSTLRWILSGPYTGNLAALTAEVSNYSLLKHKTHIEASAFSCSSMGAKIGTGLGTALVGWLLTFGKYDGAAAVQQASANNVIIFMFVWLPLIFHILIVVLLVFLKVEEANEELSMSNNN